MILQSFLACIILLLLILTVSKNDTAVKRTIVCQPTQDDNITCTATHGYTLITQNIKPFITNRADVNKMFVNASNQPVIWEDASQFGSYINVDGSIINYMGNRKCSPIGNILTKSPTAPIQEIKQTFTSSGQFQNIDDVPDELGVPGNFIHVIYREKQYLPILGKYNLKINTTPEINVEAYIIGTMGNHINPPFEAIYLNILFYVQVPTTIDFTTFTQFTLTYINSNIPKTQLKITTDMLKQT